MQELRKGYGKVATGNEERRTENGVAPSPAYTDQDTRFDAAFDVLREGIARHVFPGAALAITYRGELVALKGLGHFTYDAGSPEVTADTIFDLASVSKAVATTAMAMVLYERGQLDLELPLAAVIRKFAAGDPRRRNVTLHHLLAHTSGLPAYVSLFERARTREELLQAAATLPLGFEPGTRVEYSDIGFILLGEALASLAGEPLKRFCQREVFGPLGMAHTAFCPPVEWKNRIPPTEVDRVFRRREIQGEVQDENAFVMGGASGHTGVFAPAEDVASFAHCMLSGGSPILRAATVELFTRRETEPKGTTRALGWDTPSQPSQSGRHFSPRSFGHLGYAGTSLWIDPERQLSVTLLTNRTWPNRTTQKIKEIRPRFHDAVVEALD